MSKTLTRYLNNIKDENIEISQKSIVTTIDNTPKTVNVINIIKKHQNTKETLNFNKPLKDQIYKVIVKIYMTRSDSVNFAFHTTWNSGNPMPLRVMYGTVIDETKNMYKMHLTGRITQTDFCLKCGKALTNEVSKLYGLGPECGQHYYINPLNEEEFNKYKQSIEEKFNDIEWEGWLPKVSIISMEAINGEVNKI